MRNYAQQGGWLLDTADHGRIDVLFSHQKIRLRLAREHENPFWYRYLFNR